MKILITGANGQLGQSIKEEATKFPEFEIIYTDINELDICNQTEVANFVVAAKPNFVVNCAAYTAVDRAETDREMAMKINCTAPENLAKACAKIAAKLIHISTDYVFDGTNNQPYTEVDGVNPKSVYGETKLAGERAIQATLPQSIIIRTAWLYSIYGNNFMKTMLRLGSEKENLNIVADQIGTPTLANDLANAIFSIIESKFVAGIYHFSNEGVASWYDFTKAIFEYSPQITCSVSPITTYEYPTPAQRPYYSVLNKSKIKTIYKIEIPHWRESLKRTIFEI